MRICLHHGDEQDIKLLRWRRSAQHELLLEETWIMHRQHPLARRTIAAVLALLIVSTASSDRAGASIVTDNPAAWALSFNDEFSGSSLDGSKWAYRQLGPRKGGVNTTDAVAVANGLLTITTFTEEGVHYTGMLGTQGKFDQTYGYFEARMKFHSTAGQWSAFWLQSPTYGAVGNPATAGTEIDVVEHRAANNNNNDIRDRYVSAVHWDGYEAAHQQTAKTHRDLPGLGNDSWHTYGLKWTASGYDFYYDDALIWTVATPVSQRSEYLILSSEVEDGTWAGNVPAGGFGSLLASVTNVQVDYVRVYSAVTPAAPSADFDADGDVDGADLLTWQRGTGTVSGAIRSGGNANAGFDGDVDGGDLSTWREQFGGSGLGEAVGVAVPEPALASLMGWILAIGAGSSGWRIARRGMRTITGRSWRSARRFGCVSEGGRGGEGVTCWGSGEEHVGGE
jgi:beta-glucanase (GH16 family)